MSSTLRHSPIATLVAWFHLDGEMIQADQLKPHLDARKTGLQFYVDVVR